MTIILYIFVVLYILLTMASTKQLAAATARTPKQLRNRYIIIQHALLIFLCICRLLSILSIQSVLQLQVNIERVLSFGWGSDAVLVGRWSCVLMVSESCVLIAG